VSPDRATHYVAIANRSTASLEVLTKAIEAEIAAGRFRPAGYTEGALTAARNSLRDANRRFGKLDLPGAEVAS